MMPCSLCRAILFPWAILSFGTMASLRSYRIWPPSIYLSSFILFLMPPLWACFQTGQSCMPPQEGALQLSLHLPGYPFHPWSHTKVPPFKELSEEEAVKEESRVWSVLGREERDVNQSSQRDNGEKERFPTRCKHNSMEKGQSFFFFFKWCWNN